jgi:acetyl esterase
LIKEHYDSSPDQLFITYEHTQFFWEMYLQKSSQRANPLASPLEEKHLQGLPPAFILTAEYDALQYEGKAYAEHLAKADVKTKLKNYKGCLHAFLNLPLEEAVKHQAFKDIAEWVKKLEWH